MITPTFTGNNRHPYPPVAFDNSGDAVAAAAEAMRGWPRPDGEPRYRSVGDLMDAQVPAASVPPLDVRVPGKALADLTGSPGPSLFTPAAVPAPPAPEPAPVPAPAPEPPAAEPFPGWLRDFMLGLLDDAAYGIGEALDKPCSLDKHALAGWCGHCTDLYERAGRYARLSELLNQAADSGSAVRTLLAEGWR